MLFFIFTLRVDQWMSLDNIPLKITWIYGWQLQMDVENSRNTKLISSEMLMQRMTTDLTVFGSVVSLRRHKTFSVRPLPSIWLIALYLEKKVLHTIGRAWDQLRLNCQSLTQTHGVFFIILFAPLPSPTTTRQIYNQNLLENFEEVSFSAVFDRHKDSFSEPLYPQSDFPCEHHF